MDDLLVHEEGRLGVALSSQLSELRGRVVEVEYNEFKLYFDRKFDI